MEIWINLEMIGYSRYSVSNEGQVRVDATRRVMKQTREPSGRYSILLIPDSQPWRQIRVGLPYLMDKAFS